MSSLLTELVIRRKRRLHTGHFAFMRSLVEGLPVQSAWHRYLYIEGEADHSTVGKTLRWLRDELALTARREKKHGIARLMLLDLQPAIGQQDDDRPSIEAFAESIRAADFSYDDLIELYNERYGQPTRRETRHARILKKQLDALHWLEKLVATSPHIEDSVSAWFNDALASPLKAANVRTLQDLIDRINGKGYRWWSGIRGIAKVKGQRIIRWLDEYAVVIGSSIGRHVLIPRSQLTHDVTTAVTRPATAIAPLEKFIVPKDLDGTLGLYRAPHHLCLMKADNDYQALLTWIKSKTSLNTQRAYRKDGERFLLWAILIKHKPLSSVTLEDCKDYVDFLDDPQPQSAWCGTRARARWSPLWRPFEGPQSLRAKTQTIQILKGFYKFLVDQHYLVGNPWNGVPKPASSHIKIDAGRSLSFAQWSIIQNELAALTNSSMTLRLRFVISFLYATGLRLSEMVNAKVGDLEYQHYPPDAHNNEQVEGWIIKVVGKGQKLREVPVPNAVIESLQQYLSDRGLVADLNHVDNQSVHLIGKISDLQSVAPWSKSAQHDYDPKEGISGSMLYKQLKKLFKQCAENLPSAEWKTAERFEAASTHWLRHTYGSHMTANKVDANILQHLLGHASLSTTGIYSTSEQKRRMQAVHRFWNNN